MIYLKIINRVGLLEYNCIKYILKFCEMKGDSVMSNVDEIIIMN